MSSKNIPNAAALEVRRVPIADLVTDPVNARVHPSENMEAITASLRRFGQCEPLVVQASSMRVIGGNGRLAAMKVMGWSDADVVFLDVDNSTATGLGIALNRTGDLAQWSPEILTRLLSQLREDSELDGTGFSSDDLDELLRELEDATATDPEDVDDPGEQEPPEIPTTRRGDLWLLGDHRLLCGDSTKASDIARVMGGDTSALLSSDPPYCVSYTGNDRPIHNGKSSGKDWTHVYREIDIADLGEFLNSVMAAVLPHIRPDAPVYIWHAHIQQPTIAAVFARHNILLHQVIIWVKPCAVFGHSYYRWRHEPCAFGWRKGNKPKHGVGQLDTIWECDWNGKARITTFHPTSKPTRLFEIPMEQHTRRGDVVLEPFNGSGSQLIAAEKLGRKCRAMEITPEFVDGTVLRWQKATGKTATLDGDGRTFDEIAIERAGETVAREHAGTEGKPPSTNISTPTNISTLNSSSKPNATLDPNHTSVIDEPATATEHPPNA